MLKQLFTDGGWGMFPILGVGIVGLLTSAYYALRADPKTRGFLDLLAKGLFWFIVTSFASNLVAVMHALGSNMSFEESAAGDRMMTRILYVGFGESLSPMVMGPAFLALIYTLTAIGQRRVDARAK